VIAKNVKKQDEVEEQQSMPKKKTIELFLCKSRDCRFEAFERDGYSTTTSSPESQIREVRGSVESIFSMCSCLIKRLCLNPLKIGFESERE
jgi:hypothetical protein